MDKQYKFQAKIKAAENVDGAYVEFPYDTKEAFGSYGIIKVAATFEGHPYRGALVKMGTECHIIGLTKAVRVAIGKEPGDDIEVTIQKDLESRLMEMPEILAQTLEKSPEAKEFFETLTDSQKNKFITFIASAKKEETLQKRLTQVMEMLINKEKMK